jgi:CRISPR-associated protein Csb2
MDEQMPQLANLLSHPIRLTLGRRGTWSLRLKAADWSTESLRSYTWSATHNGARAWATVTPIVIDRHFKTKAPRSADGADFQRVLALRQEELEDFIARSCRHIGLPVPIAVTASSYSVLQGVPGAREFPPILRGGRARFQTHASLIFAEPIRGPVLLGAGRYQGYGLCRPLTYSNEVDDE